MPIYEYRCTQCGEVREFLTRGDEARPERCPQCGGTRLERVLSVTAKAATGTSSCEGSCGMEMPCCGADLPCRKR